MIDNKTMWHEMPVEQKNTHCEPANDARSLWSVLGLQIPKSDIGTSCLKTPEKKQKISCKCQTLSLIPELLEDVGFAEDFFLFTVGKAPLLVVCGIVRVAVPLTA